MNKLKDLREDSDITQEKLSKYLDISQRAYSSYESGDRNVPIDIFVKPSKYYNTSIDYLTGLTDEKKTYPRSNIKL